MAHVEPMDIDGMESDYEDKENSILHSNALPKIPCTDKGYEELDVSELNMKLRYSITPASSPMSRSYTANCKDNKNIEDKNNSVNIGNADLTSSLNSTLTNDDTNKESKVYPLQTLPTDNLNDMNRSVLIPKSLVNEDNNITITVGDNVDENFSIPSTSSSIPHTPEATTPTKELPKDGGSPIMRGLRSVLSMFKPQSPQPSHEPSSQADSGLLQANSTITDKLEPYPVQVSTPLRTTNRISPKRTSPLNEILVFNDDLEKELQWNDDSTILFKEEKIPKHKLFLQEAIASSLESKILNKTQEEGNKTLEYMDISYNETIANDKTMTDVETKTSAVLEAGGLESDGEFVDCETTYNKDEIESLLKSKENITMHNSIQHISMKAECNPSDFTKNTCSLNLTLPVESSDLLACTSKDVVNSEVSFKNISGNYNLDSNNVLQETFSLTYSKDRSLCETELPVNSDISICDSMVNNYSASNVEVNKINIMEVGSAHDVNDTVKFIAEQIKDNIVLSHVNESYPNLHEIGNELECKENIDEMNDPKIFIPMKEDDLKTETEEVNNIECSDAVQFGPVDEDVKSKEAVCTNSLTSEIDPILSQTDNQITCNTKNESLNSEAIDLNIKINIKNKIAEESNKEIMEVKDFLVQTSNNISENLEINFGDNLPRNNCREILSQNNNIGIEECAESSNEINNSNNVENQLHDAEIILPDSELNKKMPFDIPLPTDSDFDKNIVDICEANKISGDIEYEVNELVQSSKINANNDLDKLSTEISNVMEAIPILKTVDKTIDHISHFVSYEPKSILENNEKCGDHTMACNKTFDKDNSFEIIEKYQEVNKSVLPQSDENQSNKIIEPMNTNPVDNVIDENPETFNDSLQPSNTCEIFELYANEISKNEFSLHCDTNSNFEKLDEEACSNMEQLANPFETKNKLQLSPPLSPSMSNRDYNKDLDDPFATKTKIRQSPTPEIPGQVSLATEDNKTQKMSANLNKSSKRKSYPIRKPMKTKKNSLNATFDCSIKKDCKKIVENYDTTLVNTKKDSYFITDASEFPNTVNNSVNKPDLDIENNTICINNNKNEVIDDENLFSEPARDITKSVFNCPEINDMNFCSFSDKQKTMSSDLMMPSGDITTENEECLKPKIDSLEFIYPEVINDQQIPNVDNETSVSRDSKNSDMKEVNTEDEDTATFNETTEFIENDKDNASSVKDMLAFELSHTALDSDNVDNGEMFIDAEAFEFLLNQNKSNVIADSGKESLFLKFDPLFTKRVSSDGIIAALKRVQNNQSTPKKVTKLQLDIASEMPSTSQKETLDDVVDDAMIQAMSKPMMVVNPAISSIVSPRKVATPKINRQSLTFTSPAMAVIDKLLSLSGNSLISDHNTTASSPVRQHNETDFAITQLREMLADKDIHVHNLRSESKELRERLSSLEAQVKSLEVESAERLKKVNDLNEILIEKTKMNKSMANVVEEYERTIASLITQIEQEKKNNAEERIMLIKERDEQTAHLASMEVSFNDLHSKYEKSKQLIYSMKVNEETYKKSIQEFEESFAKLLNNYELLKQHATSKLNHANLELEKFNRAHEAEILKLNALIKRKELHITSLEETLAQKTKANEELTAICDELINKVG